LGQTLGVLTLHSAETQRVPRRVICNRSSPSPTSAPIPIQNAHYVERVKQLAYLDGLTGIFNRRFFELRIMEEIERARRYGTGMAVIMADIDQVQAAQRRIRPRPRR
jgi:GGDEF domain-containing protein